MVDQIVVDRAQEGRVAEQRPDQVVGIGLLVRDDVLAQIIEAGDAGQPLARVGELEFLAELVLVDADEDVADLELGGVDIDIIVGLELAIGGDRAQGQLVG